MTISIKIDIGDALNTLGSSQKALDYSAEALDAGAKILQRDAQRRTPIADGTLRSNITTGRLAQLLFQVNSRARYGAYVERGTGLYGPARRSIGKCGPGPEGLDNIAAWIKRKGITPRNGVTEKQLPFLIARKVARDGTRPQPYLEPAANPQNIRLITRLVNRALDRAFDEQGRNGR